VDFGHFDDARREFVITRPDTPLPWLNYLGQDEFFGLCTNTGGGYSFWRDAKLRRLTRYRYNNMPLDLGGRYVYVNDSGSVWNPGWKPVKAVLDRYECRVGMGYSRILGAKDGLAVELLFFIPPGRNEEVWKVSVRNESGRHKSPRLFSFQEFALFEALNDMTNYQRTYSIGEVEVDAAFPGGPRGGAIYHKTEYRERRSHYALFGCTGPVSGFDTDRDAFVGVHEGLHEARVPFAGACSDSVACGWNPVGAHELRLELAPGAEEGFAFVLAYVDNEGLPKFESPGVLNKERGREAMARYATLKQVDAAFAELRATWEGHLGRLQASLPDKDAERMLNAWNQYQCMATFNLSRSASLFETGIGRGMGFRDSNQDLLGFVHMIPARARERILDLAATQLSDGTCYHQYQPLTKKGNADIGGDFYDDHLWLVLSACAYVRETGDLSILEAPAGYADRDYGDAPRESLLHHLETSIAYTLRKRGPHGLPLIGHADWNDCLNLNCFSTEPNESFQTAGDVAGSQAESVMIAGLFLRAAANLAALYEFMGRPADAARHRASRAELLAPVEAHAWDGDWYLRAFDAVGRPVGSKDSREGRLWIESQAWCVLGGAGREDSPGGSRAGRALESVHRGLYSPDGVILQQPAFTEYRLELGEVTSYPPGVKENAGIFCHNNAWIHLALCELGQGDRALEYYRSICPSVRLPRAAAYRCEPYVYAQMIAGRDSPRAGEAKNSWLTGTAAWTLVALSQGILGLKPDFAGLRVDPCVASAWKGFSATRVFRGITYEIEVRNPRGVCRGVRAASLDGAALAPDAAGGVLLPLLPEGSVGRVIVELG
jgi:cellobiose phosphorylase